MRLAHGGDSRYGSSVMSMHRTSPRKLIERFPLVTLPWWATLLVTLAAVTLGLVIRQSLASTLPPGLPFTTFYPVVLLIAFVLGARWGLLAAIASAGLAWYFFMAPSAGADPANGDLLALLLFAVAAGTTLAVIHWLQRANFALRIERETSARLADTRELLFRELQHRVSNNLQMVSALLTIQKKQLADPAGRAALDEASRRLSVIGRISRQLYDPAGGGRGMSEFLNSLAGDVIDASGRQRVSHIVEAADDAMVTPEAAIPIALIVAETVANAIEHGFTEARDGRVSIRFNRIAENRLALEVENDGRCLPHGFALEHSTSLGLQIAAMLARQLGGSFALLPSQGKGVIARLEMPAAA